MFHSLNRRYIWVSAVVHVGLILAVLIGHLVSHIRQKKKPHEIMTFIDIQASLPEIPAVAPVPEPVAPEPEPEPEPIPEPVKKKKKPIEKSKKRIRRQDAPKPKPKLTRKQIQDSLKKNLPTSAKRSSNDVSPTFLRVVHEKMYAAWNQPSDLSAADGVTALGQIRIHRDGSVSKPELIRRSGNPAMDESVMRALRAVSYIMPLPAAYRDSYRDVSIEFALTGGV